jgi:plasmid maintenance system killer protein
VFLPDKKGCGVDAGNRRLDGMVKDARRACPQNLWNIAVRKLDRLDSVIEIDELRVPTGNRMELLSADRRGQHSGAAHPE